jgi:enoyl-CoA hydratase/carnithine racemase
LGDDVVEGMQTMTKAIRPFGVYSKAYSHIDVQRSEDGILELRLHTDGGPLVWGRGVHAELENLWKEVSLDQDNQIVILAGTGDFFIGGEWAVDSITGGERRLPAGGFNHSGGKQIIQGLLDIEVPMIAAVNGPCVVHSEQAILCDVVLAAETASFRDAAHFPAGLIPGDGIVVAWAEAIGLNRARYFLLTGQELCAQRAYEFGAVNEVLPVEQLMPRARELAAMLLERPPLVRRLTRQVLVQNLKRRMLDELGMGLALEGLAMTDFFPGGFAPRDPRMEGR